MAERWRSDVRLSERTRYRIGGVAARFAELGGEDEALEAYREPGAIPHRVLGHGANLLVSDEGVPHPVVVLSGDFKELRVEARRIEAGGGAPIPAVVQAGRREARAGLHPLEAVPGTMGGALRMNAGTREWGVWEIVEWADALFPGDPVVRRVRASDVDPGYRRTGVPEGTLFLRVRLVAEPGDADAIEEAHLSYREEKLESQPYDRPSCGSIWKNPPGRSVWRLIDEVGMRGAREGGARVSELHTNFIVNVDDARAEDVIALMRETRRRVLEEFGIALEPEVRLWGFPDALLRELGAEEGGP